MFVICSLRHILLCIFMWIWRTNKWKFRCLFWCVSEIKFGGKFIVDIDMCLRYWWGKLLCTVMCVLVTGWGKYYFVNWCVNEVQVEGNDTVLNYMCPSYCTGWGKFSVYGDVCLRYRLEILLFCTLMCLGYKLRVIFLCTLMCVWGTRRRKCNCVHWCLSEI